MENRTIDKAERLFYKTYNRFPAVLNHEEGVKLHDTEGTEYLNFRTGTAVMTLGYHNAEYTRAVREQAERLLHTSNLFHNQPSVDVVEKLLTMSGMNRVFFANNGTEAIEGVLKTVRRYAYNCDGHGGHEITAMEYFFHGGSIGALPVTGNDHYQEPFRPLFPGMKFAVFNDLDSVKTLVSENTCAIIVRTIQGEGSIYPATEESPRGVRTLCDEYDILLILDEIQCGMGRSGSMFAWQEYGMKSDVMTMAKVLGNSVPIDALLASDKTAAIMQPGGHGITYDGNPLVCVAASKVLSILEERGIVEHIQEVGAHLWEGLEESVNKHDCVATHHGEGPMQGPEFSCPTAPIVKEALLEQHLALISAGSSVIRFVPPLIIGKHNVDLMIKKLEQSVQNPETQTILRKKKE